MKKIVAISFFLALVTALVIAGNTNFAVNAQTPTHGVVSIVFDDNYQDQYDNAKQIMETRNITGTFYVVTDHIRGVTTSDSQYMTISEIQTLQNEGHEIGSHSKTHSTFTSLSEAQIRDECSISKQVLTSYGLFISSLAYPNGPTNNTVDSIVSQYYRSGRTAYVGPYPTQLPTSQFRIPGYANETTDYSSLPSLKALVDQVYSTNSWAIILFHHIKPEVNGEAYTTSTQDFTSLLDYIISKGVQTLTVDQTLNLTPLSMTTNFGTFTPPSGLYALGSALNIQAFSPAAVEGERYVWNGWTGNGSGSYSGTSDTATITLNGPVTETASWTHEYKLTVTASFGTTTPSAGEYWYAAGSTVNITASPPTAGSDERYTWLGWDGSGSGSYNGTNNQVVITLNSPITEVASWKREYKITLISNSGTTTPSIGEHWYVAGTPVTITASPPIASADTRATWAGWTGSGASSYTGTNNPIVLAIDGPVIQTASWNSEYKLTVTTNLGTTQPSVGNHWYEAGTSVNIASSSPSAETGVQYICSGWSGTGSVPASGSVSAVTFTINAPSDITWTWKTQYYLTVSSAYGTAGGAGWYDAGSSVYASITPTTVFSSEGSQYVFTGWSGGASGSSSSSNTIVLVGPKTAIANWSATQTSTPTPAPTAIPTPTSTVGPSVSPSQPPSDINNYYNYILIGLAFGLVPACTVIGVLVFRKTKKKKF